MAIIGSCENSNEKNDFMEALNGDKVVHRWTEKRKIPKRRKYIFLAFIVLIICVTVVGLLTHFITKATTDAPDVKRRCIEDGRVLNGKLTNVTGLHERDTADIECHDGYQVNGSSTVSCLFSGHWNETPVCLPLPCRKLVLPKNTMVDLRHLKHKINEVNIACDHGYILEGEKSVFCQNDGFWSEIPTCRPVDCDVPPHIEKGIFLNLTGTTYNNTFSVKCEKGYTLNGKKDIRCESNGKWDYLPECNPVQCVTPIIPDHAHIYGIGGVSYKDTVSYKCENSYVLIGRNTSTCKSSGTWSTIPECKVQCLESINVTNGRVIRKNDLHNKTMWLDGDIAHIECLRRYKVKGSNVTECLPSGKWSERPSCVRKQCAVFETPKNSEIKSGKQWQYYVDDEVAVSCLEGFRLNGSSEIVKCLENEEWSSSPTCVPINCQAPHLESNVLIHKFTGVTYNSIFHVTCKHGYKLKGAETVRCGLDGKWIGRPRCEPISCGPIRAQANAYLLYSKCMVVDCETLFVCRQGYHLIGDGIATCQANGQWSSHYACVRNTGNTIPARNNNNDNNNNNHQAKSGCAGIHGDVGINIMAVVFVLTIIIQAFFE